ncbi:Carboxylic ester hydrolase [Mycena sanguinolenta]|uniref:Carboxylic ester hydrolase n=1 Tax=Mycena sanguinolenta TaxID=230812 RepID=A0A8H7CNI6_9AGAR|nr:Carboxylic ester hydrolase [Mycena sanguinolenta]
MGLHLRIIIATVLLAVSLAGAQTSPIVDLGYAQYQGVVNPANNITHFLGIRYAAAPLGDLRFRGAATAGQHDRCTAGHERAQCLQGTSGTSPTNPFETRATEDIPAEDCLFLNVYYPSNAVGAPRSKLPTLVWIHGGGYVSGAASGYDEEDIINQSARGVVVVSIQYRLGVFGKPAIFFPRFFGSSRWVQLQGKASFLAFEIHIEYIKYNSCTSATDPMSCLRAVDANTLRAVNTNITAAPFFGTFVMVPVVDGVFIQQRPTLSLAEGKVNGEALLSVANSFEGTIFVNQNVAITAAQYSLELFPGFGTDQADIVSAMYANDGDELFQVNAVQGESIFICPTYYLLNAFPGRSFKGEFAIPPGLHGEDIAYYFPGGVAPPFNNPAFIDAFAQSFTSFIVNQDPNLKVDPTTITPHWNAFDNLYTEMLFNKTADNEPVVQPIFASGDLLERCAVWDSMGIFTSQ